MKIQSWYVRDSIIEDAVKHKARLIIVVANKELTKEEIDLLINVLAIR